MARTFDASRDANPGPQATPHAADAALAAAVLRRDPASLDRFLVRMRCVPRFLVARSRQIGADLPREVVEDLTQEVVTLVWRKLEGYRGDAALETWVYRFCDLELRNAIRKGAVRAAAVVHVDPGQLVDQPAEPSAPAVDAERMHRVIDALAADEAAVVRLKHFEQLTFEDVAAALGCSPNTAKTRYYRALGRMRAALARAAAEPGEGAGGGR